MAYRVFFGVIPENRHSSTTWAKNQDFFRGLFRSESGPAEPADVRLAPRRGKSPVRPSGQPMMRLAGTDLACVRGGRQVFRGLSFALGAGEALLVTGPNGAGKSSLLRLVAGLVRLDGGPARVRGRRSGTDHRRARPLSRPPGRAEALAVGAREPRILGALSRRGGRPRATRRLAAVGLDGLAQLPASYLSAGQRRRLSLARLIAVERPIWLLDEPTTALDTAGPSHAGRAHARPSRRRRADRGRGAWTDRARPGQGAATRSRPMTQPLARCARLRAPPA